MLAHPCCLLCLELGREGIHLRDQPEGTQPGTRHMPREMKLHGKQLKEGLSAWACTWQSYSTWYDTIYTKKAVLAERGWSRRRVAKASLGKGRTFSSRKKAFNLMSACIFHRCCLEKGHLICLHNREVRNISMTQVLRMQGKTWIRLQGLKNYFQESHVDKGIAFWLLFLALALRHLGQVFSALSVSPLLPLFASSS